MFKVRMSKKRIVEKNKFPLKTDTKVPVDIKPKVPAKLPTNSDEISQDKTVIALTSTQKAPLVKKDDSLKDKNDINSQFRVEKSQSLNHQSDKTPNEEMSSGNMTLLSSYDDEFNGIIDRLTVIKEKFNKEVNNNFYDVDRRIICLSEDNDKIVERIDKLECRFCYMYFVSVIVLVVVLIVHILYFVFQIL